MRANRTSGKSRFTAEEKCLIYSMLRLVTRRLGYPGLFDLITTSAHKFSESSPGMAYADFLSLHISVDTRYFREQSRAVQKSIVAHEVCHLVNYLENGPRTDIHGREFIRLFKKTGFFKIEQSFRHRTGWPVGYNYFPRR